MTGDAARHVLYVAYGFKEWTGPVLGQLVRGKVYFAGIDSGSVARAWLGRTRDFPAA